MARDLDLLSEEGPHGTVGTGRREFNPLDHPILFSFPGRLTAASGWREHIPLGMLLVDLARPTTLVELGTQGGDSYCAFCQAVDELGLDTSCYAVDTWEGDEHTGFYGPEVLAGLRAHHDPLYGSFSSLIESSFEQALGQFRDGQVDFLHIDGCHTYDAVKADFESWLPKMSSRGIVVFHDTNVMEEGFGVHRLWAELRRRYPHFEVDHGHGLGVIAVGDDTTPVDRLARLDEERAGEFRRLLFGLGRRLAHDMPSADPQIARLQRDLADAHQQLGTVRESLRWQRELGEQREDAHRLELATEVARADAYRDEAWSWCVRAGLQENALAEIHGTRSWRLTRPFRVPAEMLARRRRGNRIQLPPVGEPRVSLIIPVHSQPELTRACLESVVAHTPPTYEVVVADDRADRQTKRLLGVVDGARMVVNEENLGFTRTVNRAAADCRSEFLVICNNDIEVRPGWLEAMIDCAESDPDVAIVVPKFVQPDGLLAEAGGIVWSDGTASHPGRGKAANNPNFSYRREVDYGSAAAMLVRADFWREVGGFDERYSPGYFEDTDLCFAARDRGLKVMFEPGAEVVHVEGASHGTDEQTGMKAYQRANAPKFVAKWRQALERQPPRSESEAAVRLASNRSGGPRVLVIDHRLPSPDLDSGSMRMTEMLRALRSIGCRVSFLPDNGFKWEPYCGQLQRMGVEVLYGSRDPREELTEIGSELRLVVLSRPAPAGRFLPMIRELAPQATVAYDTVDLHFLRERRRVEVEHVDPTMAETFRSLELALIETSDLTICVSDAEAEAARAEVPDARFEVIANAHPVATEVPGPNGRRDLLFVGGFIHTPNVDAVRYLTEEIMPLVWRDAPEAVLRIVGSHAEEKGIPAFAGDGIVVDGWVEDLEGLMDRARLMVAPLRYGAGVKGKITHSLARGLPVVTTPVGAEGLDATAGSDLLLAGDAEAFAWNAVRLTRDDALWERLSSNGLSLAERRFSRQRVAETMRSMLSSPER